MDNNVFFRTKIGTPQGGLLSPLLANITLTGMEDCLGISYNKVTRKNGSTTYNAKGNYRMTRYADDFVIFAKSKEEIEKVYDILNPYLEERGLILAEDKTRITHISEGFDFLGFETRQRHTKDGDKCFIKPSKDSLKNARTKIAERFELMKVMIKHNYSPFDSDKSEYFKNRQIMLFN